MFAILDLKVIRELSDRELKVYASLLALSHGGNGIISFKELMETTKKKKTQLVEIINLLIQKGLVKRLDKGKYELIININLKFEIDFDGFNNRERKKIAKLINEKGITKDVAEQIINYLKNKKAKDKAKYFAWLLNNYDKVFKNEINKIEKIKISGVDNFYDFQSYLNKNKISYKFSVLEKPRQIGTKFVGGEWEFEGMNINKIYQEFKQKNRRQQTVGF